MADELIYVLKSQRPGMASLPTDERKIIESELKRLINRPVYPKSITVKDGRLFCLAGESAAKYLVGITLDNDFPDGFEGDRTSIQSKKQNATLLTAPVSSHNALLLQTILPFLKPAALGLKTSAGCGDRLGVATPGHIRAVSKTHLAPIFAQQSVRENERTGRTPRQVLDDALWAVFQEGWQKGFGADADHLKNCRDMDLFAAAGYTFFTIDPGEHVDNSAQRASEEVLERKVKELPWSDLETTAVDLIYGLTHKPVQLEDLNITLTKEEVMRAAAKYGRVVAHTVFLYRHLLSLKQATPFDLEISVDETDTVTSLAEHIYLASELKRLGVKWVSLAPRYVGSFEKGVDYIGNLSRFETAFARHVAVARTYGPYKLSLHSGSDKFRIYPAVARLAKDLVHLKTAGTSYLEALRTIAEVNTDLFKKIFEFAVECYPKDRASYHVSAEIAQLPQINAVPEKFLPNVLNYFHAREILHVTYGSVINHPRLREAFFATLHKNIDRYYQLIEVHFDRHFTPFI